MVIRTADGTGAHARLPGDRAGRARPATCTSTRDGEPTERSVTGHLAGRRARDRRRPGRGAPTLRQAAVRRGHRARDPAGPRRLRRSTTIAASPSRSDSARLSTLPRLGAPASSRRPSARARQRCCRQPDLAATLEAIRDHGADGFYRGRVADLIVAEMERGGGLISQEDLAAYQRDLARADHHPVPRDTRSTPCRPASSRRRDDGRDPQHHGGVRPAAAVRLARACCIARRRRCGARSPTATATWATRPSCRTRSSACSRRSTPAQLRGADRRARHADAGASSRRPRGGSSTTHYSVVDAEGNAVSCTTTLNNSYGSAVTVTGAGFLLNDEMDDFATAPGQAQHVRPGAGRGQRDRARQAHALGDDAEHRARPGGPAVAWWWARRAARASSRWCTT